jgi:hypothetical protein
VGRWARRLRRSAGTRRAGGTVPGLGWAKSTCVGDLETPAISSQVLLYGFVGWGRQCTSNPRVEPQQCRNLTWAPNRGVWPACHLLPRVTNGAGPQAGY